MREHRAFASVHFVSLADVRGSDGILSAMANALSIPLRANPLKQIGIALSHRGSALIILDNVEHLIDHAAPAIRHWLEAAPELRVITTSRAPLRLQNERCYTLELLSDEDAIELFVSRAREASPRFTVDGALDDVRQLVQLLDRLPLAIELAAARSRLLSPAALLKRMVRRFDVLQSRNTDVPERQRTLRATLQWSWEMLTELERSVLAQLSVFEGGFTLEAADAVVDMGTASAWVEDVLTELVDKSLLTTDDRGRLRMLVSVQAFAVEQLVDAEAVERRHGAWFSAFGSPDLAGERLHRERENFQIGARRAALRGDEAIASDCADWAVLNYLDRGPYVAGVAFVEEILVHISQPQPRGTLLRALGSLQWHAGNVVEAAGTLNEALELTGAHGNDAELVRCLCEIGEGYQADQPHVAEEYYAKALKVAERSVPGDIFRALARMAVTALLRGELELSEARFTRALELAEEQAPSRGLCSLHGNFGSLHFRRNQLEKAEACYRRGLELARHIGDVGDQLIYEGNLGNVAIVRGQFSRALRRYTTARQLSQQIGNPATEAMWSCNLGTLEQLLGNHEQSLARFREASALAPEGSHHVRWAAECGMAHVLRLEGRYEEAEPILTELFTKLEAFPDDPSQGAWFTQLGQLRLAQGRKEEAQQLFDEGIQRVTRLGLDVHRGKLLALRAMLYADATQARAALDEADALLKDGSTIQLLFVRCLRVAFEVRMEKHEAARAWFQKIRSAEQGMEIAPASEVGQMIERCEASIRPT